MYKNEYDDVKDTFKETYSGVSKRFLSQDEERYLSEKAKEGDIEARNEGVKSLKDLAYNLGASVHRRYKNTSRENSMSIDELAQQGLCGALEGFNKFDPDMGYRFTTYFTVLMVREMEEIFSRTSLFGPRSDKIFKSNIKEAMKEGNNGVQGMYLLGSYQRKADDGEENYPGPIDFKSYEEYKGKSPETSPEENVLKSEEGELLSQGIFSLDEREQTVIREIYYESKTLKEIASELDLTQQRVHQIKWEAIGKLKNRMQGGSYQGRNGEAKLEYFIKRNGKNPLQEAP